MLKPTHHPSTSKFSSVITLLIENQNAWTWTQASM